MGDGGGRGLVDDVEHFEAGHVAGVLRGLAAHFVEIGRHRDHDFSEIADLAAGVLPQFVEHEGLQGLGRILAALQRLVKRPFAQFAFRTLGHVLRFGGQRFEGLFADHRLLALEQHHAGSYQIAFRVDQRHRPAGLVNIGDRRVRGTQIDSHRRYRLVRHTCPIEQMAKPRDARGA